MIKQLKKLQKLNSGIKISPLKLNNLVLTLLAVASQPVQQAI
jgi:hypothetical protein